ncbi:MAG: maiA [Caballeronia mineralivorans]|jgi:maleylpyruvate isomerase|nr:maiA [Caballeronia mineralivorans]
MITLYNYFRSSASYRVRIALALKGLSYEYIPVHLTRGGGEQFNAAYRELNADALTPTFVGEEGQLLTQSLAIVEYLDETHRDPPLLPASAIDRAYVRSLALQVACEMHPLNNLRVLAYLKQTLEVSDEQKSAWYRHWIDLGFSSLEKKLSSDKRTGLFCFGDTPTLADLCLVPQVFNAQRMGVPLDSYPTIVRITSHASTFDAFNKAEPVAQIDAA